MIKRISRWLIFSLVALLVLGIGTYYVAGYIPFSNLLPQKKTEQRPEAIYDYYVIVDENSHQELMYVPLVVSPGDEVITEDNKLYRVQTISGNTAYARYIKDIKLSEPR